MQKKEKHGERKMRLFRYGMKKHGYGHGNQPLTGFYVVDRNFEIFRKYFDIIVYQRKLTETECHHFDLDFLGEVV